MVKDSKKWRLIVIVFVFIIYIFAAPRPIPNETVLVPRWISSLESDYQVILEDTSAQEEGRLLPFTLGNRFGYVGDDGKFVLNKIKNGYISLSEYYWAEYETLPLSIQVMSPLSEPVLSIENPKGYPLFLDERLFIISAEQNSIRAIGPAGEELWTFDLPAPITCFDAAAGFVLAGTLDGTVVLLNSLGIPVIAPFEPGGSRLSVILGCAISQDASHLAIISGIENQRFLLLERTGGENRFIRSPAGTPVDSYRVVYHEFLSTGFRRPVQIAFVNNDSLVVFEREGGLGMFTINSRTSINLKLDGEILGLDNSGEDEFLFVLTSLGPNDKRFTAIRSPGLIVKEAPFKSSNVFLSRQGKKLFIAGDQTMASFRLEKR